MPSTGLAQLSGTQSISIIESQIAKKTIPTLDAIRGISAGMVVLAHLDVAPGPFGGLGVSVFFVLSGFLITTLLLRERDRTGRISMRNFIMRRALRLFPAMYVWLIVSIVLSRIVGIQLNHWQLLGAALYLGDYVAATGFRGPALGVAWSLGVEEKFYLLWPWLFRARITKEYLIPAAIGTMAACWLYRIALWTGGNPPSEYLRYAFEARLDSIMYGCLMALCIHRGFARRIPAFITNSIVSPLCLTLALLSTVYAQEHFGRTYEFTLGYTLQALLIAAILLGTISNAGKPGLRWMDSRPMRFLGSISYSTYLYHTIIIACVATLFPTERYSVRILVATIISYIVAWISQHFIEAPFLRLKHRYEQAPVATPHSASRRD
jgi:peptidoglycan/LPS O-acetylase OafA/YrhL